MAEKKIKADPELLAAARLAYAGSDQEFWDEVAERLFPESTVPIEPLPRRDSAGTV